MEDEQIVTIVKKDSANWIVIPNVTDTFSVGTPIVLYKQTQNIWTVFTGGPTTRVYTRNEMATVTCIGAVIGLAIGILIGTIRFYRKFHSK
jgi:ABC-type nitrate/sulfonate/bicarbonate transport system permease component